MKVPPLALPRLGLASFRRRLLFRGAFLLLVLATLALALVLLTEEKQRSYENHRAGFRKTEAEIIARLRHPSGQLALLNPGMARSGAAPLRPLLLPYSALDFDDQNKVQQAIEMAGCSVRYADGSSLCVAVGSNPYAGGFIYLAGSFAAGPLLARERSALDLSMVHRARVSLDMRGASARWTAPFETQAEAVAGGVRGRLTGFAEAGDLLPGNARPVRDFRGWLWQAAQCAEAGATLPDCARRTFVSIRLPVEVFRDDLFQKPRPVWPPADLERIAVRLEMLGPAGSTPLFDSAAPGATPPPALDSLAAALLPGETLGIERSGARQPMALIRGADQSDERSSPLLERLVRALPVEGAGNPLSARTLLRSGSDEYIITLTGDARGIDRGISVVATRMSWFVGAMLGAIALAWLLIEVGLIRRIALLTRRAAAVSHNVQGAQGAARIGELDLSDLRGRDELGILAGGLADLLDRVKDDVRREHLRARQERDMWHAVGHEIMSPLQSLMVLHPEQQDPSHRYVQRMRQAVRVLYGTASPSEALAAASLAVGSIDLAAFLANVAGNAHFSGIDGVRFAAPAGAVMVRADEFSLEDVVTHILRNADRLRTAGSAIEIGLATDGGSALVEIFNQGPPVAAELIDRIFDYGVSSAGADIASGGAGATGDSATGGTGAAAEVGTGGIGGEHRGQGLFVVRTYMAKMGGTVAVANRDGGVAFTLMLQRTM